MGSFMFVIAALFFFAEKVIPKMFSPPDSTMYTQKTPLYFSARSPHLTVQSNMNCLLNLEVPSHSLTQALT